MAQIIIKSSLLLIVAISLTLSYVINSVQANEQNNNNNGDNDPAYWRARRDQFYLATRFNLTDINLRLLGRKRTIFENESTMPTGHLPFWFDYKLFKKVFNKPPARDEAEELARHQVYISTCMRVLKVRVLYRMLAGTHDTLITSDADQFYWEKFGNKFAPENQHQQQQQQRQRSTSETDEISLVANFLFGPEAEISVTAQPNDNNYEIDYNNNEEPPLGRAVRLMRQEMDIVESRNQVETYLKAFREFDGSAIDGKLPY